MVTIGIHLILHDDGNTLKRVNEARGFESSVQPIRLPKGLGIDRDDRIEARTFLVIGFDAVQVKLHQLVGGQLTRSIRVMTILDGSFR